jgi:hypothetical protein
MKGFLSQNFTERFEQDYQSDQMGIRSLRYDRDFLRPSCYVPHHCLPSTICIVPMVAFNTQKHKACGRGPVIEVSSF